MKNEWMNFCCRIMSSSSRHENLGVWVLIAMVSYLDFSPAYPKWSDFLSSERYRANSQQRRRHLRQISFKLFLKGHLFLVVVVLQIKIIHVWLIRSIVSFTTLWRILLVGTPDTLRKFLPFSPPPPRNFHWPSWGGGGERGYGQFLESHIQYIKFILVEFLEKNTHSPPQLCSKMSAPTVMHSLSPVPLQLMSSN